MLLMTVLQGIVSSVFLLVGDVFKLINYCAFVEVLSFATCSGALLYIRYKQPNLERPIKVGTRIGLVVTVTAVISLIAQSSSYTFMLFLHWRLTLCN